MDFKSLSDFVYIAEKRNLTKAAEGLFTSQQALSKSISRMEEELGVPLFTRSRSGVVLTEYGKQFLPYASAALQQYHSMAGTLRALHTEESDLVSFGYATGMLSHFLPQFLGDFMASHPEAHFSTNSYQDDAAHRLGTIPCNSISLVSTRPFNDDYRIEQEFYFPLSVMLAKKHPLANKEELTWKELSNYPIIGLNAENDCTVVFARLLTENGIVPRFIINASEHEYSDILLRRFQALVFYGGPISVISADLKVLPLNGLTLKMSYYLCVEKNHVCNPTELEFIEAIKQALQE